MNTVNQGVRKLDAMQLVTGQPVYTEDIAPENCLVVKLLRSPHANAMVREIDTERAMRVPGMEAVFTWKDVPQNARRYTQAGQTAPEPSPLDRLVIDRHVRFAGDVVAILAGRDEACVDKAMKLIKVEYDVLEPVLDFRTALDNPVLVHPEDNWEAQCPVGADNRRNLCAHEEDGQGDIDAVLRDCDIVIDRVYHTKACQQTPMETFRTFCTIDTYGRLHIVSSTQIVFHTRRIVANALHIPRSKIRVSKPRVGGGFGAKQTAVSAVYPAFVTWMTKKPSMIVFSRRECMIAGSPRHEMEMHVRLGADKNGIVRGIDLYTLSNTGAYGEHGPTTVGLSGHKSIPLYAKAEAYRFVYDVVYTNHMSSGAYRGYGATQGLFAVESAVNELAARLGIDPFEIRKRNIPREGEIMPAYYGQENTSCALEACLESVRRRIGWDEKYPCRDMGNGKVRAVGMGMAMQGSGINNVDVGSATLKLNDGGGYTLLDRRGGHGHRLRYDPRADRRRSARLSAGEHFRSRRGYGFRALRFRLLRLQHNVRYRQSRGAVRASRCAKRSTAFAARMLACSEDDVLLTGSCAETADGEKSVSLGEIALASQCGNAHRARSDRDAHLADLTPAVHGGRGRDRA